MNTLYTTLLIVYVLSVLGILVYTVLGLMQQRYITVGDRWLLANPINKPLGEQA